MFCKNVYVKLKFFSQQLWLQSYKKNNTYFNTIVIQLIKVRINVADVSIQRAILK